ncbi:Non-specific lipid-transfer protein-like protein [Ananas comosus]|uniref:Non-specific lipid-transfer protein-like protein n=1 Tax=Ananas comosus TaxID=4615 RepID=A0A199VF30_ANACO|nr:Non-specific lipid-transfer protein-like protein [Ananas comosus]
MASRTLQNVLFVALTTTILCGGALAQSSSNSCTSALVSLSPCLNYIAGNESAPSSSCCSQLANVVQSEPQCLCVAVNGGASSASSLGINVNQTQALALPGACKVQTPPISQCQGGSTSSSTPDSSKTPSVSGASPGGSSKTVPTAATSDANSVKIPFTSILSFLLIAVYSLASLPAL